MHLEAKTPQECEFLITCLETYFGVWLQLEKNADQTADELEVVKKDLQEIAGILVRFSQYFEAYPEAKDKHFYTKLEKHEVEHLLQAFNILTRVRKDELSEQHQQLIAAYTEKADKFINDFCNVVYDEALVKKLFKNYKAELKNYCNSAIAEHVEDGNEEVYVFAIQSFPGHHYQLATMNTVESLHAMADGNGFEEAATYGYHSELYNPACFDIECVSPDTYDEAEEQVKELNNQFYELTDEYSDSSYKEGTIEHANIEALASLSDQLFIEIAVEVLKEIDFSPLNQSKAFCAIVASHEFTEDEFYTYAKQTVPADKFDSIFPNADRREEDYIDFEASTPEQIVTYLLNYLKDFNLKTIPEDRYYTSAKVYEYNLFLTDYPVLIDHELLLILEEIVAGAKPNPNNPEETHFLNMFSNEGKLFSDLLSVLSESETFAEQTQGRLIAMFKKIITGMVPSTQHPTFAHRDLAVAILSTDKEKYPELEYDLETSYLKNVNDYLN